MMKSKELTPEQVARKAARNAAVERVVAGIIAGLKAAGNVVTLREPTESWDTARSIVVAGRTEGERDVSARVLMTLSSGTSANLRAEVGYTSDDRRLWPQRSNGTWNEEAAVKFVLESIEWVRIRNARDDKERAERGIREDAIRSRKVVAANLREEFAGSSALRIDADAEGLTVALEGLTESQVRALLAAIPFAGLGLED